MIRIAVLTSIAAVLAFVALATDNESKPAQALIPAIDCDAKIGVVDNEGFHPWLWPYIQPMLFTQQPKEQDGSRLFSLGPASGDAPIPIAGIISPNGTATGSGAGTYSGFPTDVEYLGSITYYDEDDTFPRRIIGEYSLGNLPGGETIVMRVDCWFDPPEDLADPDDDDVPGMRHDTLGYGSASAGRMDGSLLYMVYRDSEGEVQEVDIADPDDIVTEDAKGGPFETSVIRKYYDTFGKFGGSFSPALSSLSGDLPPELGGGSFQSVLSGVLDGRFRIGTRPLTVAGEGTSQPAGIASAVTVVSFEFNFHAHGMPFNFLESNSGDWSWRRDPNRPINVTSLNLATGQASLTVPVLLDADNLRGVYPDTPAQAQGANGLPGEPLRFTENVNIAFPPLGLITSAMDNCPDVANPAQEDFDGDGVGDACEGVFWVDASCNTSIGPEDALLTLARRSGVTLEPFPTACDGFGAEIGDLIVGDWDCDRNEGGGDVIVALLASANLPPPADYPVGCPPPGDFLPRGAAPQCDASYPDFCIPPPPPQLSCEDVGQTDFAVLPPDPHGFDGDDDGEGCES